VNVCMCDTEIEIDNSGHFDNGSQTQTENVADNGGVSASHNAWKKQRKEKGTHMQLPGIAYSDEQLFWIAWGMTWCELNRPHFYDNWTNVHSPGCVRVKGVVMNSNAFAKAFQCDKEIPMNPNEKCVLW